MLGLLGSGQLQPSRTHSILEEALGTWWGEAGSKLKRYIFPSWVRELPIVERQEVPAPLPSLPKSCRSRSHGLTHVQSLTLISLHTEAWTPRTGAYTPDSLSTSLTRLPPSVCTPGISLPPKWRQWYSLACHLPSPFTGGKLLPRGFELVERGAGKRQYPWIRGGGPQAYPQTCSEGQGKAVPPTPRPRTGQVQAAGERRQSLFRQQEVVTTYGETRLVPPYGVEQKGNLS